MPSIEVSRQRAKDERLQAHRQEDGSFIVYNVEKRTAYVVTQDARGYYSCTCPYMTKGSRLGSGVCKHMVLIQDLTEACKIRVGSNGKYALVDKEDYTYLSQFTWSELPGRNTTYARRNVVLPNGRQKTVLMHKEILDVGPIHEVDHINDNGLDNRRINLRKATPSQQRAKMQTTRTVSRFRGVRRSDSKIEKYNASIMVEGKNHYLGTYSTDVDAAKAYDRAARKFYGEFAVTNF